MAKANKKKAAKKVAAPKKAAKKAALKKVAGKKVVAPKKVAKKLPKLDFEAVWVVGLHGDGSKYVYGVTRLDLRRGNAPTWLISINDNFNSWAVTPHQ